MHPCRTGLGQTQSPAGRSPRERILSFKVKRRSSHSEVRPSVRGPCSCCLPPGFYPEAVRLAQWPQEHHFIRTPGAEEGDCLWSEVPVNRRVSLTREGGTEQRNQMQTSVQKLVQRHWLSGWFIRDHGSCCCPDPQSEGGGPPRRTPFPQCQEPWEFNVELQLQNSRLSLLRALDCF